MEKQVEYAFKLSQHILSIFEEENSTHIPLQEMTSEENIKHFIHAMANLAPTHIYNKLTKDNKDLLQFNHLANHLIMDYSLEEKS